MSKPLLSTGAIPRNVSERKVRRTTAIHDFVIEREWWENLKTGQRSWQGVMAETISGAEEKLTMRVSKIIITAAATLALAFALAGCSEIQQQSSKSAERADETAATEITTGYVNVVKDTNFSRIELTRISFSTHSGKFSAKAWPIKLPKE